LLLALVVVYFWEPLLTHRVLLPTDICLRLQPWRCYSRELFPEFHNIANPLLDVILSFVPWRMTMVREMSQGILPLWNPYILCGTPFVANNQSAIFYPFNWLFFLFPIGKAFTLYEVLEVYLCGAFLYLFLRRIGVSWTGGLIGAVAWMFSGFVITWLEWQVLAATLCWLPLILLFWEKARAHDSLLWATPGGLFFGIQLLAGHLQSAFYSVLAVVIYALWQICTRRSPFRKGAIYLLWILGIGMCLGAIQTFPVFELARFNHRQGELTYEAIAANAMPVPQMLTLLVPRLLGTTAEYMTTPYSGKLSYPEMCFYMGILPLTLASAALLLRNGFLTPSPNSRGGESGSTPDSGSPTPNSGDSITLCFGTLALLAVLVGTGTPLLKLFYTVVPGFRQMPSPARIMVLLTFSGSILSALGWDALREVALTHPPSALRRLRWLGIAWLGVPLAALIIALLVYPQYLFGNQAVGFAWPAYQARNFALFLAASLIGAALLFSATRSDHTLWRSDKMGWGALAVIILDLFLFGMGWNPSGDPRMLFFPARSLKQIKDDPEPGRTLALRGDQPLDQMTPNANMVPQIEDVQGGESLYPKRTREFMQFLEDQGRPQQDTRFWNAVNITNLQSPLLPMLNVRYILTSRALKAPQVEWIGQPDINLYRLKEAFPRCWIVPQALWASERSEILSHLDRPGFNPHETVILQGTGETRKGGTGAARIVQKTVNSVIIEAQAPEGGWLVLADTCAPGWKAALDGQPVPIYPANYLLRAVWLPPGQHQVHFRYLPSTFRVGMYLSLLTLALVAGTGGFLLSGRRKPA